MAKVEILLQGLSDNHDHETAVKNLLRTKNTEQFIISVAFARARGVRQLQTELCATRGKIAMYIGIANGVTSAQALSELLAMGIEPFVVDMGSNVRIYHPKIYASIGPDSAQIIMGSANLTYSGLNENVEASTVMTLDKSDAQDLAFITSVESTLGSLSTNHPFNVFKVKNQADVKLLVDEGRLEDESIKRAAIVTGHRDLDRKSVV